MLKYVNTVAKLMILCTSFLNIQNSEIFWNVNLNLLKRLSEINLKNIPIFNECILFGFPNRSPKTKDKVLVINYCIWHIIY